MALVSAEGESVIVGAATVSVSVPLVAVNGPAPVLLSVAVTVKLNVPPAVGVPESVPLLASEMPAGSAPEAIV